MSLSTHLNSLQDKHKHLEAEIAAEAARPLPDFAAVTGLKKKKLHLKEEIQQFYRDHPELDRIAS